MARATGVEPATSGPIVSDSNWFESCLLLPVDALMHYGRLNSTARYIAGQYGVSENLVNFRRAA